MVKSDLEFLFWNPMRPFRILLDLEKDLNLQCALWLLIQRIKFSIFFNIFLTPKTWKNRPQKLLMPRPFYFTVQPRPQPTAQNWFSYYEISGPDICSLTCGTKSSHQWSDLKQTLLWDFILVWLSIAYKTETIDAQVSEYYIYRVSHFEV